MNNAILIRYDNTPTNVDESFLSTNTIYFNYNNSNYKKIDEYISKEILTILKEKTIDKIFIKDNLSANYLELYGLRVAYHIRLSIELNEKRFVPIIILSDLDGCILNRLEPMAKIIFTKNVFLESNTKATIEKYNSKTIDTLIEKNFLDNFLNLIEIQPPENSSSHNIANQWAIDRWAEFLKVDTPAIQKNKATIENMLYFKYLISKYLISKTDNQQIWKTPNDKIINGKILYIDDESINGWEDIFKSYFSLTTIEKTSFKTLSGIEKNMQYETLSQINP